MTHIRSFAPTLLVYLLSGSAFLVAQVQGGFVQAPPPRDVVVQQPTERPIPVGTSSISGTVVAADSGKPIAGARVTVSGSVPANVVAPGAGRGGAAPPRDVGVTIQPVTRGGANAVISSPSSLNRFVMTDSNGQFSFPRMPAGNFTINVSVFQNQFLSTSYGARRPNGPGRTIPLADGEQLTVKVPLLRPGVISGTVYGPDGEPQRNVQVRGLRYDTTSGFKRVVNNGFASTDDRGVYRMHGLQPGEYFISATPNMSDITSIERMAQDSAVIENAIRSGQMRPPTTPGMTPTVAVPVPTRGGGDIVFNQMPPAYLPTYAPSSPLVSGATKITVAGGDEKTGVDVFVRLTQATTIQGTVTTQLDPVVQLQLSLVSEDTTIDSPQSMQSRPERDGKFYFRSVPPGKYTVVAQTMPGQPPVTYVNGQPVGPQPTQPIVLTDAQKMWARVPVTVAGEPTVDITVSLQPSKSISGMVIFDMQRPPDLSRARYMVSVNPAPSPQSTYFGQLPQAEVGPDGRFSLKGVSPGRYVLRVNVGNLKSSIVNGQDTLDFPLEFTGERDVTDAVITVTDTASELSGTLMDAAGKPATDYMIVAASSDERFWAPGSRRVVVSRPGPDGRYIMRGLPPGAYMVAVVMDLENGAQYDPEFLRSLPNAGVPVIIGEGAKMTQDLRVK